MSQGRPILIPVQCNPIRAPRSCLLICWSPTKQEPFTRRNSLYIAFGSSFRSMYRLSTLSGSQMVGKAQKSGEDETEKGARCPSSPQFPPLFLFALSQFPRVYSLRPPHFRSNWVTFPKCSSSFDFE